jgi:carbon monoxide dehydrogenase subunit G
MLKFEGDKDFQQPQAVVWRKLSDARFLAQCIPGVESISQAEPARLACTLRPGFAFVRGTLDLSLTVTDAVSESSVRIVALAKGIGSSSEVEATLTLAEQPAGTRMHWQIEIKNLGGLLKAVPQGLVKAAAQKVIADALTAVDMQLNSS